MPNASAVPARAPQLTADQLRTVLAAFVPQNATHQERIAAIEIALRSATGRSLRDEMARWIVDEIVPVSRLVPESYLSWRPPVRDAMTFVVARLSPGRLAPKLLEQLELPRNTSAETRLLRLIAKVPGLQKLGQVIARNQHLRPALRAALTRLENGVTCPVGVSPVEVSYCFGLSDKGHSFKGQSAIFDVLQNATTAAKRRATVSTQIYASEILM